MLFKVYFKSLVQFSHLMIITALLVSTSMVSTRTQALQVDSLTTEQGLIWNTFLGLDGSDGANSIVVDESGNTYVVGASSAAWSCVPLTCTVRAYTENNDGFVGKIDPSGVLIWNTFLGGSGSDNALGIVRDKDGNVYVVGTSDVTWGDPVGGFNTDSNDAYVAKLDSSGALLWNTFLGGWATDLGNGIAVDGNGNIYVVGFSDVTWGNPVRIHSGYKDAFVAKLDSSGALVWNTFLGGTGADTGQGIAQDGNGNVYVVGSSAVTWGNPVGFHSGNNDAYVARLDSSGALVWNTFLGSGPSDTGNGITVDVGGNVYASGTSSSTWGTPVRSFCRSSPNGFVAKLDSSGALIWNTFLGACPSFLFLDNTTGIAVDASGNVYIAGASDASWGYPLQDYAGGNSDGFVAKLDSSGGLTWNTFLGGSGSDTNKIIAVDTGGNIYAAGLSDASWGSPVRPYSGNQDAFAAKLTNFIGSHPLISGNVGVGGAMLNYFDDGSKTAIADDNGDYSFLVAYNWSGTVTPSKDGYVFSPSNRIYNDVQSDQINQNYIATAITYTISGNAGVADVTLSYTDGIAKTATSVADGSYSFTVSSGWSGTVTPSKDGYTFSPADRTYNNVLADQTNQDYIATTLSPKVVVFLEGIGSDLTKPEIDTLKGPCSDASNDPSFGDIKIALAGMNFICDDFLRYSYKGGSLDSQGLWKPNTYACKDTGQELSKSVKALQLMLDNYRKAHPNAEFVLIGHSLGGVISLETTKLIGQDPSLPVGSIAAVITIDSPLNHMSRQNFLDSRLILKLKAGLGLSFSCRVTALTDSKVISQLSNVTDANRQAIRLEKEALVTQAKSKGVKFMTIGNEQDCVFYLTLCKLDRSLFFLSGEWIDDRPTMLIMNTDFAPTLYPLGVDGCDLSSPISNPECLARPHALALHDPRVTSDIAFFLGPNR